MSPSVSAPRGAPDTSPPRALTGRPLDLTLTCLWPAIASTQSAELRAAGVDGIQTDDKGGAGPRCLFFDESAAGTTVTLGRRLGGGGSGGGSFLRLFAELASI